MDLFRKCMEPVEKCLRDAKMDKSSVSCWPELLLCLGRWPACSGGLSGIWRVRVCCSLENLWNDVVRPHQPSVSLEKRCSRRGVGKPLYPVDMGGMSSLGVQ